jgi:hypothetical protein
MAFLGKSTQAPLNERGEYNWEVFTLEDRRQKQVTNLRSFLSFARISDNGAIIAFGADPTRAKNLDLSILNLRTGDVVATGLLARLQLSPDFRLH